MKRGDVVRTVAQLEALPTGTEIVDMDARRFKTNGGGAYPCDALGIATIEYPALVRVVGPVEPEWLEAARVEVRKAFNDGTRQESWTLVAARAAVAAADKARGIVNTREEFDALPAGTICWAWLDSEVWQLITGPNQQMPPSRFPVVVVGPRA